MMAAGAAASYGFIGDYGLIFDAIAMGRQAYDIRADRIRMRYAAMATHALCLFTPAGNAAWQYAYLLLRVM